MFHLLLALVLALAAARCAPLPDVHPPPASPEEIAAAARASSLPAADGSVKFLVIGDSGTGDREQYEVAAQIALAHRRFPFAFAIMLGDNLYGREGPADYVRKFERPYAPLLASGVTFHASLGNHDSPAQRFYALFNMNGRRYYSFRRGAVELFALDSNSLTAEQVEWLQGALTASGAGWKVVFMHHPLYSSGQRHGSQLALQRRLEPLFLEHGVDVVFAGHDHFYERLQPQKGIHYFIQGGSAKLRRGNIRRQSALTAAGFDQDRSFTLVEIDGDRLHFETISRLGAVVDAGMLVRREALIRSGQ